MERKETLAEVGHIHSFLSQSNILLNFSRHTETRASRTGAVEEAVTTLYSSSDLPRLGGQTGTEKRSVEKSARNEDTENY